MRSHENTKTRNQEEHEEKQNTENTERTETEVASPPACVGVPVAGRLKRRAMLKTQSRLGFLALRFERRIDGWRRFAASTKRPGRSRILRLL
jgi:hypothetical protein